MLIVRDHVLAGQATSAPRRARRGVRRALPIRRGCRWLHHGQVVTTWAPVGAPPAGRIVTIRPRRHRPGLEQHHWPLPARAPRCSAGVAPLGSLMQRTSSARPARPRAPFTAKQYSAPVFLCSQLELGRFDRARHPLTEMVGDRHSRLARLTREPARRVAEDRLLVLDGLHQGAQPPTPERGPATSRSRATLRSLSRVSRA